eukprot:snap_masked-scaffold_4-processed-gene-9.0-mRNA-1 protein AED:1.00 eAED:1.00 QI:0/-1/0/0/-1/1/1/0/71
MNLDGSWTLKTSSSAEEMLETLKNYVAGCFRTREQSPHNFMQSETKKKFGVEEVSLRGCKIVCTSSENYTY